MAGALILYLTHREQFAFFGAFWLVGALTACTRERLVVHQRTVRALAWMIIAAGVVAAVAAPHLLSIDSYNTASFGTQFVLSVAYACFIFIAGTSTRLFPSWLVNTAAFSYSLYVIHFPLFLLLLSLTQTWMGASLERTLLVCVTAVALVLFTAFWFARFFENQRLFAPWIRNAPVSVAWGHRGSAA